MAAEVKAREFQTDPLPTRGPYQWLAALRHRRLRQRWSGTMPSMALRVRKEEDLRQAARHVSYEIAMLVYSADHLSAWQSSPPSPTGNEANMALESFLLHFRNLRAFLCPSLQACSADDVVASDFLGNDSPTDLSDRARLGVDKRRLDKLLAHLSYSRRDYIETGDYAWNIAGMLIAMLAELQRFLALLPPEQSCWLPSAASLAAQQSEAQSLVDRVTGKSVASTA
jgi:hypothetical protein